MRLSLIVLSDTQTSVCCGHYGALVAFLPGKSVEYGLKGPADCQIRIMFTTLRILNHGIVLKVLECIGVVLEGQGCDV